MATVSTSLVAGSSAFSTKASFAKSIPPMARPMGGMITWSTRLVTILPKAPPMITPTARSMTLPRARNSLNSLPMLMPGSPLVQRETLGRELRSGKGALVGVQPLTQFLAALEERHVLGLHRHRLAGARISAGPRRTRSHGKSPKAPQFDASAGCQSLNHAFENHTDDAFNIALSQMRILGRQFAG